MSNICWFFTKQYTLINLSFGILNLFPKGDFDLETSFSLPEQIPVSMDILMKNAFFMFFT